MHSTPFTACQESLPHAFRAVSSIIVLSYQNAEVERDLAIVNLGPKLETVLFL